MVVVSLSALLAVPVLNAVLDLYDFGNLAPFFYFSFFKDFFEDLVFLRLVQFIPIVSIFFFHTWEVDAFQNIIITLPKKIGFERI